MSVEDDGVQVDVTVGRVAQDDAAWRPRHDGRVVAVAEGAQGRLHGLERGLLHDEVEVRMRTGLHAEERVDSPAPVDPVRERAGAETVEHREN